MPCARPTTFSPTFSSPALILISVFIASSITTTCSADDIASPIAVVTFQTEPDRDAQTKLGVSIMSAGYTKFSMCYTMGAYLMRTRNERLHLRFCRVRFTLQPFSQDFFFPSLLGCYTLSLSFLKDGYFVLYRVKQIKVLFHRECEWLDLEGGERRHR